MLYILYTPAFKIKFSEYVPNIVVRATSPKKARDLALHTYPKHPLDLYGDLTEVASVKCLWKLQAREGFDAHAPLYFCHEDASEEVLRKIAMEQGAPRDSEVWRDPKKSEFVLVPPTGRAEALARTDNRTPYLAQPGLPHPVFCWKSVAPAWPNKIALDEENFILVGPLPPAPTARAAL
jgi:hypothetical protein